MRSILVYNILNKIHFDKFSFGIWEEKMPHYDYLCLSCDKKFSVKMTIKEHDTRTVKCPECGSEKVEQQLSQFYTITSKKS
jgi:putative FmdB family regulatory protein